MPGEDVHDAETIVAELAANGERHARPPYEVRLFVVDGVPVWCEVVDGDPDPGWIPALLDRPRGQTTLDLFAERGRGLIMVRELSQGYCRVCPTTVFTTGASGKAVGFALPTRSGERLAVPPPPHLARRTVRLRLNP
ncbi:hypothetical protein AB0D67_31600 [Streptosporangium sp. NPDC048047]|uniref:ATP-binding protein n=1 Tax=Streptosporangium sp. NPDC048047 TaxID=3155748 RepID=UPI00343FC0A3